MRIIYGLSLGILFLLVFVKSYRINKDIFSPLCFFSLMQFIAYVPGIMFFEKHYGIYLDETNTFWVFLIEIIVILFIWLGVKLYNTNAKISNFYYHIKQRTNINMTLVGLTLFIIGFIATIYYIYLSGGISYIIGNTQKDYAAGRSYLLSLQSLMIMGIVCFYNSKKRNNSLLVIIAFSIFALTVAIFTRRAPIIEGLLLLVMAYNYKIKRLRLATFLKPKNILLILFFSIIVVLLPTLRNPSGFYSYLSFLDMFKEGWLTVNTIFEEYSFVSRDAFVYTNYNLNNMYYGRTIINILTAPLPSSIFSWKPPVDDGMYLANFMRGYYVLPPTNILPIINSMPFSSQGSMYANFGIIGVIIGSLLMGIIYAHSYRILKNTKYNVFMILIYKTIIYKLALSSKNIVQTLIFIVLLFISFKVLTGLKLVRKKCTRSGGIT